MTRPDWYSEWRRQLFWQKIGRVLAGANSLAFADLLFLGSINGSQYSTILVSMDRYAWFVKAYCLKYKDESMVSVRMKKYIACAECQKYCKSQV